MVVKVTMDVNVNSTSDTVECNHNNKSVTLLATKPMTAAAGICMATKANYIHMPECDTLFRCYVVALQSSLSLHLDINMPESVSKRYASAINYSYSYIAEEFPGQILQGRVYSCHLKNVEIAREPAAARECNIFMSKEIYKWGGWFLVNVGDIDIYRRILVTLLPINSDVTGSRQLSINERLLECISPQTGNPIAVEYVRPRRTNGNSELDDNDEVAGRVNSSNSSSLVSATGITASIVTDSKSSSTRTPYYIYVYPDNKMKTYLKSLALKK